MLITDIKRNEGNNIGHVGLALIGEMARVCGLDTLVDRLGPGKAPQIKSGIKGQVNYLMIDLVANLAGAALACILLHLFGDK